MFFLAFRMSEGRHDSMGAYQNFRYNRNGDFPPPFPACHLKPHFNHNVQELDDLGRSCGNHFRIPPTRDLRSEALFPGYLSDLSGRVANLIIFLSPPQMSSNNNNKVDKDSITYRNALRRAGIRVIPGPVDNVSSFHDDVYEVFKLMPCIPKSYRAMVLFLSNIENSC